MKEKTIIIQLPVNITYSDEVTDDSLTRFEHDIAKDFRVNVSQYGSHGTMKAKSGTVSIIRQERDK